MCCYCGTRVGVRREVEEPLLELPEAELGWVGMGTGEAENTMNKLKSYCNQN